MKLPNDLIKATDYDKAKDRIIKEFECVNGKVIQHYVLGGEHELTMQEIIDCLNALATIDCDLQTAYSYIEGQKDKLADLESKLAESEKKARTYAKEIVFLDKKLENLNKEFELSQEHNEKTVEYWQNECSQLKQQLAEKDKEIEYQESMKILAVKNQNQTAIAELEKVKEKLNDYDIQDILSSSSDPYGEFDENCVTTDKINEIIDQQIKSLKGGKQ